MLDKVTPLFKTSPKLSKVTPIALSKRGITKETCELFGYGQAEFKGMPVQVATYKDQKGNDVAPDQNIKIATLDKHFHQI